jgi:hypothetical protein
VVAVGGAAVAAAVWVLSMVRRQQASIANAALGDTEDGRVFQRVLVESSKRFYLVARDVACLARTYRQRLEAKKQQEALMQLESGDGKAALSLSSIDEEWLKAEISRQCQVRQKMQTIEKEVLLQEGCSETDFAFAQRYFRDNQEVRRHVQGTQLMLQEALDGKDPVLPGFEIPEDLHDDALVAIHSEIRELELTKARDLVTDMRSLRGKKASPMELGHAIAAASQDAERQVFQKHSCRLGKGGEKYLSAVALRRRSPNCAARFLKLEEEHREAMVTVMREHM